MPFCFSLVNFLTRFVNKFDIYSYIFAASQATADMLAEVIPSGKVILNKVLGINLGAGILTTHDGL